MRWYAVKTKSGQDHVAIDHLQRQDFEVYYPRVLINLRNQTEPLFPGYVLARFDVEARTWRVINSTRGVKGLLSFSLNGIPAPLPDDEVSLLQDREKSGNLRIPEARGLRHGDEVRVAVGPRVDMIGRVVRTKGERIEFLMRLLGRKVKCIAPLHTLELVSGSKDRPVR